MCQKCENKQEYKYYKSSFGTSLVKTQHMDLTFDMFEDKTLVNSIQTLEALENVSQIRFDAWDVEILEIKLNQKILKFDYNKEERFVVIWLDKVYEKGEKFNLEINNITYPTHNILEGLYYDTTPKGCPAHQITQCQQWGFRRLAPCVDDMTTKCTYKTTIIADSKYTNLITNGDIAFDRTGLGEGRDKIVYKNDKVPMATYLFFLGAGTWETYTREFEYPDGTKFDIELLLKPNTASEEEARKSLEVTADGIMYIHLFTGKDKYKNWSKSLEIYELCKQRDEVKKILGEQKFPSIEGWQSQTDGVFLDYKNLPFNPKLLDNAKKLRKSGNLSEVLLWDKIKENQLGGVKFIRQKVIGNYIVDFYSPDFGLVIEIDGFSHELKGEYDVAREKYLTSLGLEVIHFEDKEIKHNLQQILVQLYDFIQFRTPRQLCCHPSIEGNSDSLNSSNNIIETQNIKLQTQQGQLYKHLEYNKLFLQAQLQNLRQQIQKLSQDLDLGYKYTGTVYREIAMENTNVGGMENVGNTTVRSDSIVPYKYMSDRGLEYLFAVKAHEFYHNLNGSEVTGFSPFEFWLNEAVTVLIESEYSNFTFGHDYHRLQTVQQIIAPVDGVLAQDDGPLAKAIEPAGFNHPDELVNSIIYVKAVEFVRMIQTILGKENFVKALADYHQKFRFSNAKSEDWLEAMQKYTDKNIIEFASTWLKQTGYPIVKMAGKYNSTTQTYTINLSQRPSSSRDKENKVWQYPFSFALCDGNGQEIYQDTVLVTQKDFELVIDNVPKNPSFISANRGLSFYGRLERDVEESELYQQIQNDNDKVSQNLAFVELAEKIKIKLMEQLENGIDKNNLEVDEKFVDLYFELFANIDNQENLGTLVLAMFEGLYDTKYAHKYEETYQVRQAISKAVGKKYEQELLAIYHRTRQNNFEGKYLEITPKIIKNRAVKNLALSLSAKNNNPETLKMVKQTYLQTDDFVDKLALFNIYINSQADDKIEIIKDFETQTENHFLAKKSFLFSLARMESDDVIEILTKYSFDNPDFNWNLSNNQLIFVIFAYNRRKSLLAQEGREFFEKFLTKIALLNDYTTSDFLEVLSDIEYLEPQIQEDLKAMLKRTQSKLDPKKNFASYNNISILLK